jgi:Concanavalin A-like lectin/glucanases superfamily
MKLPLRLLALLPCGAGAALAAPPPVTWTLNSLTQVGGVTPTVWGAPQPVDGAALQFNGKGDGLLLPVNPLAGQDAFTVAILFKPDGDGPVAQRFLHAEDATGERMTIESRVVAAKGWYMDTFLLPPGKGKKGLALIDPTKLHPLDQWAWGELVYDGQTMTAYVNGVQELTGQIAFPPMGPGKTSVGARQNKVFWFKGQIKEVRFYPAALAPADLPPAP